MRTTKSLVAVIIMMAMLTAAMPVKASATYTDVPAGHWASDYIYQVQQNGLMSRVGDGRFAPEDTLLMAQICQILFNISGQTASVNGGGSWYTPAVNYVQSRTGLTINPNDTCTRGTACLLIYKMGGLGVASNSRTFSDVGSLDTETQYSIVYCAERGIISGYEDGTFRPYSYLTRAEAAKIFSVYQVTGTGAVYAPVTGNAPVRTVTPIQMAQTAKATGMATLAQNLGLYTEVVDHPDSRAGYSYQDLLIYTTDGRYTFTYGGSNGEYRWFTKTTNSDYDPVDADFIQNWLKTISVKYSDTQKITAAKRYLFDSLEELDMIPEVGNSTSTAISFGLFGGLTSRLPAVVNGYTGNFTLTIVNGALVVNSPDGSNLLPSEFLNTVKGLSSRMTVAEKAQIATEYIRFWTTHKGWQADVVQRDNSWTEIKCRPSSTSPYYVFVVGGTTELQWYNEAKGSSTLITRASVDKVLR